MASKRKSNSSEIPVDEPKRRHGDTSTDGNNRNVKCTCTCTCGGVSNYRRLESMIEERLESKIEMVKRELAGARYYQPPRLTSSNECGEIFEGFELRFTNKLQEVYYTKTTILAEGGEPVQIALFDIRSQCVVRDGAMSCMEVNICVVDSETGSDIIKREGKKKLLKGDTTLILQHGRGVLPKNEFTDNSCWVRNRTFSLAAKSKSNDPNIREAVSKPFIVKEKRGEPYEKHGRPSLTDNIWRLRNIAKDGIYHKRLSSKNIETVKDLMRLHTTNPSLLKQILGNISSKTLEAIIDHAKAYATDGNENYIYLTDGCRLVLNSIYEVVRVSFDGQYYVPSELDHYHKQLLEQVKQQAYQNEKDFIVGTCDDLLELANPQVGQFGAPQQGQPYSCGPSTLENGGSEIHSSIYCNLQQFDFSSAQQGQASTSKSLVGVALQNGHVATDQMLLRSSGEGFISQIQLVSCLSPASSWGLQNPFGFPSSFGAELSDHFCLPYVAAMVVLGKGNGKTVWNKIRNALEVVIPFVAKRKQLLEQVKQQAYQNEKDFIVVTSDDLLELANPQVGQFGAPQQGQPYSCGLSTLENGGSEIHSSIYCNLQQFDFSSAQQGPASTSKSLVGVALQNGHMATDQTLLRSSEEGFISQIQLVNCLSPASSWGLEDLFGCPSSYGTELSDHSCLPYSATMVSSGKGIGKIVWNKIRNALRVVIPFVAKRKAKLSIPSN